MYSFTGGATMRMSARPSGDLPACPDLDEASGPELRTWLGRAWDDPSFAAAVELASPALAAQVRALLAAPHPCPRTVRRATSSSLRYQRRLASRATPFGLFAGVAPLEVGGSAQVRIGEGHRARARVDHRWITAVVGNMLRCSGAVRVMPVVVDGRVVVRDGRLVLPAAPSASGQEVSIRLTAPVEAAVRRAGEPVVFSELRDGLVAEFPAANPEAVHRLLATLLAEQFLVSALYPPMTAPDPLAHVIGTASRVGVDRDPDGAAVLAELRAISELLGRHDVTAAARDQRALRGVAVTRMREVAGGVPPIGVDLVLDVDVTVPRAVPLEATHVATALVHLAQDQDGPAAWRDYLHRFLDRYGVGAVVPLQDLLHAGTGLGYPVGYRGTQLPSVRPPRGTRSRRRAALLTRLAQAAVRDRSPEVELTDTDLDILTDGVDPAPQPHTDLRVEVHAATREELDEGRFELLVVGASRAAGTVTGRFLDLLDPDGTGPVSAALRGLPTATRGALQVQLSGAPAASEAATIARSAAVLDQQLAVGGYACAGSLRPADLAVSADPAGLYLVVAATGEPVEPTAFTALELVRCADPTVRFLCEIAASACTPCAPFSWDAALRELPFLPRVRYRRTILSPARWNVRTTDLAPAATPDTWTAWRDRWAVPDRVLLGRHDQRLGLDLTASAHRALVADTVRRTGLATMLEAPAAGAFGWIDDHAHELVLPLATNVAARHPDRPRPTSPTPGRVHHTPGASSWIYAHLTCRPANQTVVLTEHLPRLLTDLDAMGAAPVAVAGSAWFLRLTEPDHHLRLRVRLTHRRHFGEAAAAVAAWTERLVDAGLVGEVQFRTYVPEAGRFGSGRVLEAAESVFAADSAAVLTQLGATAPVAADGQSLTAASMVDIVAAFTGTWHECWEWLIRHAPRTVSSPGRETRARAIDLAHPDRRAIAGLPNGDRILAAWDRRRAALTGYRTALLADGIEPLTVLPDLLHLHHARAAGPYLEREAVCLTLARAAALSHRSRTTDRRTAA